MNGFFTDLRFALRQLAAKPGFAGVAILTLAIGIGVNTAVFSMLNGYFLKPLPYPQGQQLVSVSRRLPKFYGDTEMTISATMYKAIRNHVSALSSGVATLYDPFSLEINGSSQYVSGAGVTGDIFQTLRIKPLLGRALTADDDRLGQPKIAVISYRLWENALGGKPTIIGKPIKLNGKSYRIVGVMPRGFAFSDGHTDIWVPHILSMASQSAAHTFGYSWLGSFVARLKPGTNRKTLRKQLEFVQKQLLAALPPAEHKKYGDSGFHFVTKPYRQAKLQGEGAHTELLLFSLQAAVLLVLLITCLNVANLLLSRILGRGHELAMRTTLGATRRRLMRQLLVEGLCLAVPGGLLGIGLGWLCVHLIAGSPLNPVVSIFNIALDWRVVLFVCAAVCLVSVLVSILPTFYLAKTDLKSLLQAGGHATSGGQGAKRTRNTLVVVQITLATALLAGAGLLLHSFVNLQNVNTGFNPDHVLAMRLLGSRKNKGTSANNRHEILRRVQNLPGIEHAAMVSWVPLNDYFGVTAFKLNGRQPFSDPKPKMNYDSITPQFFKTLQIPILHGRSFNASDTKNSQLVAIVDARFAKHFFPNQSAIGQDINLGEVSHKKWVRIVGVAQPIKLQSLEKITPYEIYLNDKQLRYAYGQGLRLMVRTNVAPGAMVKAIKRTISDVAPSIAVYSGTLHGYSMKKIISRSLRGKRMFMFVALAFGCIALLLAVIGVYGVLSYAIGQRRNEFGIRLALGAMPGNLQALVIKDGLKLLLVGLFIGLALAVIFGQAMASLLFHVSPYDPLTLGVTVVVLALTTLFACYLPARRATKLNPAEVIYDQ
ncbi:MAG: ABC transporter permease [Gammaproteobacteria bacterium]